MARRPDPDKRAFALFVLAFAIYAALTGAIRACTGPDRDAATELVAGDRVDDSALEIDQP